MMREFDYRLVNFVCLLGACLVMLGIIRYVGLLSNGSIAKVVCVHSDGGGVAQCHHTLFSFEGTRVTLNGYIIIRSQNVLEYGSSFYTKAIHTDRLIGGPETYKWIALTATYILLFFLYLEQLYTGRSRYNYKHLFDTLIVFTCFWVGRQLCLDSEYYAEVIDSNTLREFGSDTIHHVKTNYGGGYVIVSYFLNKNWIRAIQSINPALGWPL